MISHHAHSDYSESQSDDLPVDLEFLIPISITIRLTMNLLKDNPPPLFPQRFRSGIRNNRPSKDPCVSLSPSPQFVIPIKPPGCCVSDI